MAGVICGVLATYLIGLPTTDGILYGLRAACLVFASRFILIVFGFSSGTNDSARFRLSTLTLLAVMIAFGGLVLVLGGMGLLVPEPGPAFAITALAMLDAYVFFRIYGWFYHRNYFDLMTLLSQIGAMPAPASA